MCVCMCAIIHTYIGPLLTCLEFRTKILFNILNVLLNGITYDLCVPCWELFLDLSEFCVEDFEDSNDSNVGKVLQCCYPSVCVDWESS